MDSLTDKFCNANEHQHRRNCKQKSCRETCGKSAFCYELPEADKIENPADIMQSKEKMGYR